MFVNLLANANKFAPEGSVVRIGAAAAAGEVRSWVEDEGAGPRQRRRAARCSRASGAAASEPEAAGLGLGLWIVKSIVERHGGRVAFERTAAARTRFTLTLPAEKPA